VNEQEFALRVGELATRIGYSIPSVEWSADKKYCARGIMLDPNGAFGETLYVYRGIEQSMPVHVQDFLIAQEFTQARLGVWRQRRWLLGTMNALAIVFSFVAVGRAVRWSDSYVVGFLIGCAGATRGWSSCSAGRRCCRRSVGGSIPGGGRRSGGCSAGRCRRPGNGCAGWVHR